jgi:hypothetical protein
MVTKKGSQGEGGGKDRLNVGTNYLGRDEEQAVV